MKALPLALLMTVVYYASSTVYDHLCLSKDGEFLRHPYDCHKFIRCSHQKAYEFQCPANLLWHHEIKSCDFSYRTRCQNDEMLATTTTTTTKANEEIEKNEVTEMPYSVNNCLKIKLVKLRKNCDKIKNNKIAKTLTNINENVKVLQNITQAVKNSTQTMLITLNVNSTQHSIQNQTSTTFIPYVKHITDSLNLTRNISNCLKLTEKQQENNSNKSSKISREKKLNNNLKLKEILFNKTKIKENATNNSIEHTNSFNSTAVHTVKITELEKENITMTTEVNKGTMLKTKETNHKLLAAQFMGKTLTEDIITDIPEAVKITKKGMKENIIKTTEVNNGIMFSETTNSINREILLTEKILTENILTEEILIADQLTEKSLTDEKIITNIAKATTTTSLNNFLNYNEIFTSNSTPQNIDSLKQNSNNLTENSTETSSNIIQEQEKITNSLNEILKNFKPIDSITKETFKESNSLTDTSTVKMTEEEQNLFNFTDSSIVNNNSSLLSKEIPIKTIEKVIENLPQAFDEIIINKTTEEEHNILNSSKNSIEHNNSTIREQENPIKIFEKDLNDISKTSTTIKDVFNDSSLTSTVKITEKELNFLNSSTSSIAKLEQKNPIKIYNKTFEDVSQIFVAISEVSNNSIRLTEDSPNTIRKEENNLLNINKNSIETHSTPIMEKENPIKTSKETFNIIPETFVETSNNSDITTNRITEEENNLLETTKNSTEIHSSPIMKEESSKNTSTETLKEMGTIKATEENFNGSIEIPSSPLLVKINTKNSSQEVFKDFSKVNGTATESSGYSLHLTENVDVKITQEESNALNTTERSPKINSNELFVDTNIEKKFKEDLKRYPEVAVMENSINSYSIMENTNVKVTEKELNLFNSSESSTETYSNINMVEKYNEHYLKQDLESFSKGTEIIDNSKNLTNNLKVITTLATKDPISGINSLKNSSQTQSSLILEKENIKQTFKEELENVSETSAILTESFNSSSNLTEIISTTQTTENETISVVEDFKTFSNEIETSPEINNYEMLRDQTTTEIFNDSNNLREISTTQSTEEENQETILSVKDFKTSSSSIELSKEINDNELLTEKIFTTTKSFNSSYNLTEISTTQENQESTLATEDNITFSSLMEFSTELNNNEVLTDDVKLTENKLIELPDNQESTLATEDYITFSNLMEFSTELNNNEVLTDDVKLTENKLIELPDNLHSVRDTITDNEITILFSEEKSTPTIIDDSSINYSNFPENFALKTTEIYNENIIKNITSSNLNEDNISTNSTSQTASTVFHQNSENFFNLLKNSSVTPNRNIIGDNTDNLTELKNEIKNNNSHSKQTVKINSTDTSNLLKTFSESTVENYSEEMDISFNNTNQSNIILFTAIDVNLTEEENEIEEKQITMKDYSKDEENEQTIPTVSKNSHNEITTELGSTQLLDTTTNKFSKDTFNNYDKDTTQTTVTGKNLKILPNNFAPDTTTLDPRLPFRSLECTGENNRRQFAALKCYQYYQCFAGWAFLLNCHEGWWFQAQEGQCVFDINKKCEL